MCVCVGVVPLCEQAQFFFRNSRKLHARREATKRKSPQTAAERWIETVTGTWTSALAWSVATLLSHFALASPSLLQQLASPPLHDESFLPSGQGILVAAEGIPRPDAQVVAYGP